MWLLTDLGISRVCWISLSKKIDLESHFKVCLLGWVSIVRRLNSLTALYSNTFSLNWEKKKIKCIFMLFESLCKVCISMFGLWILEKINEILKSHAHHIFVAYETVGLSSCRTIELSDYRVLGLSIGSHLLRPNRNLIYIEHVPNG